MQQLGFGYGAVGRLNKGGDVFTLQSLHQFEHILVANDADAILYVPSAKLAYVANWGREAYNFDRSREARDGRNYTSLRKAGTPGFGLEVWIALSKS
jgi:hypothetical protein